MRMVRFFGKNGRNPEVASEAEEEAKEEAAAQNDKKTSRQCRKACVKIRTREIWKRTRDGAGR
jgi:hypothetical protein